MQSHLDHEADVLVSPHLSLSHKIIIFIFYFLKYENRHPLCIGPTAHIYIYIYIYLFIFLIIVLEDTGNNKTGHG